MKKVLIYPKPNEFNHYINNLGNAISRSGKYSVEFISLKEIRGRKYDVLYLNWIENIVASKSLIKNVLYFVLALVTLLIEKKVKGKSIVMTYHNKLPHENMSNKLFRVIAKSLLSVTYDLSDKVVVHSKYAVEYLKTIYSDDFKVIYIPHGNYLCNYKPIAKSKTDKIRFAFFGQIRAYKGLEKLIESFKNVLNDNIELIILGNPQSEHYKNEIIKLIDNDRRIKCDFRYINDEEIPKMFSNIDIMVLPYIGESFLTSGSAILSFTLGTPIIAPDLAMFKDYKDSSFVKLFNVNDKDSLMETISEISTLNLEQINRIQEEAYTSVTNYNWCEFIKALD